MSCPVLLSLAMLYLYVVTSVYWISKRSRTCCLWYCLLVTGSVPVEMDRAFPLRQCPVAGANHRGQFNLASGKAERLIALVSSTPVLASITDGG